MAYTTKILLTAGFVLASFAPLRAGGFGSLEGLPDIEVPAASAPEPPVKSAVTRGGADVSEFFKRLESIGLRTDELRAVTGKVGVYFREMSGDAAAQYGYILNNLYIPRDYCEAGANRVRFDLKPNLIDTLLHEYVHAAFDVRAAEDAPKGTPAREHYDAVAAIRADLRAQSYFYRYSWMKADEVSGYFMGAAIGQVFDKAEDIIFYNTRLAGARPASMQEALELGGRFILPKASGNDNGFAGLGVNTVFGRVSVYDMAMFKADAFSGPQYVHWEERQFIKDDMYRHILGLNPPKDTAELLERMNTLDNPWLRETRKKVAEARIKNAGGQPDLQPPSDGK